MSATLSKPFPSLTGSCICNKIRYRLVTSPLFCYVCHCIDCQKTTGSAFELVFTIELYNIQILSPTSPVFISREKKPGILDRHAECPQCGVHLWAGSHIGEGVVDVRVGTLDFPGIMVPDVHIFVESKLEWVFLPEGARTRMRGGDLKGMWPESSRRRLEVCGRRVEEVKKRGVAVVAEKREEENAGGSGEGAGGDRTPTAGEAEDEDDEVFEQRFKETEQALLKRLETLSLKVQDEEVSKKAEEMWTER